MGLTNNLGKLSNMITSTGSAVGIAQTSPSYTLDVNGTGRFSGDLAVTASSGARVLSVQSGGVEGRITATTSNWYIGSQSSVPTVILSGGATALTLATTGAATFSSSVTAGGNITSVASTGFIGSYSTNPANDAGIGAYWSSTSGLEIKYNPNSAIGYIQSLYQAVSGQQFGDIQFRQNVGGTMTTRMIIKADGGNVGIGTSSPSIYATLSLNKNGTTEYSGVNITNANSSANFFVGVGGSAVSNASLQNNAYVLNAANTALILGTNDTERMRITSGGSVGIGTSNPSYLLDLWSTSATLRIRNITAPATGGTSSLLFEGINNYSGTSQSFINSLQGGSSGATQLTFGTSGAADATATERMRITSGGLFCFGISSSSSTSLFYAKAPNSSMSWSFGPNNYNASNIFRVEDSNTTGVYLLSGNTSWSANSDERLKNIVGNIENAVSKLCTLRTVEYTWKKDKLNKVNLGLIAQDVLKVLPEVVDIQEDEINTLGVKYTELVPVLIAAIQEQQQQIEELKAKIK